MHHLVLKDMPERYRLSFDPETASLRVMSDMQTQASITELIHSEPRFLERFPLSLKLPAFIPPDAEAWGFGPRIATVVDKDRDIVTWTCRLPPAIPSRYEHAETGVDHQATVDVSASLQILIDAVSRQRSKNDRIPQIAHVNLYLRETSVYSAPLSAMLSPVARKALRALLRNDGDERITQRTHDAIARAIEIMFGWSLDFSRRSSRTMFLEDGRIMLMTFGSATELSTDGMRIDDTPGTELVPHNTDTPCQQLSLLWGLAALCDTLRPYALELPVMEVGESRG